MEHLINKHLDFVMRWLHNTYDGYFMLVVVHISNDGHIPYDRPLVLIKIDGDCIVKKIVVME